MALILNIDTSTSVCSVVLAREGKVVAKKEDSTGQNHSLLLGTFIDTILKENNLQAGDLDAVAVSMGPGSYTGLRIGVSMAKGLCYGASLPLIGVNTLQALALAATKLTNAATDLHIAMPLLPRLYCPMIDARRMEVYTAVFDGDNQTVIETKAEIITPDSFADTLNDNTVFFLGNGAEKAMTVIQSPNARYISGVETSAENMTEISEAHFAEKAFEDVAYFEPFYLKDFIATTPKNKVL
ncbi:MAG: tRNA (adenosine(37)-N6)-threonylcarbamoyltransferase complex dimerization subunit type 1 TsaB [Culturomica sp.]|jgi:tRNA threonylcarbamoyladenosine biosynthesis protein TsaB|nr:tRNA (adenosine(37)-N6)-threonylcarbamoyltransferase complex dimerization subunit type 1 TsaB [Culturomica sp.]